MDIKPTTTGSNSDSSKNIEIPTRTFENHMVEDSMNTQNLQQISYKIKDPQKIIPNGIYSVFQREMNIKKISILWNFSILFLSVIAILLLYFLPNLFNFSNAKDFKIKWAWYIIPAIFIVISLTRFTIELIELSGIHKSIDMYRITIKNGATSTPPFIALLYKKLMIRQVRQTWAVVAIVFYIGVFIGIFWGLKDAKWGLLDWQKWIHNTFPKPEILIYVLCGIIGLVLILFIFSTIFKKKRMVDIQSFFGNEQGMNFVELDESKRKAHIFYAKIFFISIAVLIVLPFIIYIILKKTVLKGK
ncbi:MSC_0882 family membrane protein [Metamycoplasma hominis]|uniref:Uncharacterized protein n=1 Tax=Metamycoplasma hominis TaxID=2098 RepID=A0A6A8PZM0_METHO|nr:hypothetical protein [Metamycoplasma hominis]MTH75918.1 hypothetical protein [Metamycoplasma hominis]